MTAFCDNVHDPRMCGTSKNENAAACYYSITSSNLPSRSIRGSLSKYGPRDSSHTVGKGVRGGGRGDLPVSPLEYKLHEGRDFCVFCRQLYA